MIDARAQQQQRHQGTENEAERLHREHHGDHLAAIAAVGVLAHERRAERVVSADAEPEDEAESNEPEDVR